MEFTHVEVWQDREVRVNAQADDVKLIPGEFVIYSCRKVEDFKGHPAHHGILGITNLRILWVSVSFPKSNISIGWSCVSDVVLVTDGPVEGHTIGASTGNRLPNVLKITAVFNSNSLEVVLNGPNEAASTMTSAKNVLQLYRSSQVFRDLKLRGSIMVGGALELLPGEQVLSKMDGILNLSSEQGNLGVMYLTSVRVVWYASAAPNFNVSIPYFQIKCVNLRASKFGQVLVIEAYPKAGGYVLGFKVDPVAKLNDLTTALTKLYQTYTKLPYFGIPQTTKSKDMLAPPAPAEPEGEDEDEHVDAFTAYHALDDASKNTARPPVFDANLGLAVEGLIQGVSMDDLWLVPGLSHESAPLNARIVT